MSISMSISMNTGSINGYTEWNCKISFCELGNYMREHLDNKTPIISVGSGSGKFEYHYNHIFISSPEDAIICIDPAPLSYNRCKKIYCEPKFSTVDDLIKNKPDIVGNCQLLIIWSPPDNSYDIDAINLLKPGKMVILYDGSESAGSSDFHRYNRNKCNGEYIYDKESEIFYSHKMFSFLSDMNYYTVRKYTRV